MRHSMTFRAYLEAKQDCSYGEALAAWDADAEALRAWDSESLDECAQIARTAATTPAYEGFARTLQMFAEDCERVRWQRMRAQHSDGIPRYFGGRPKA